MSNQRPISRTAGSSKSITRRRFVRAAGAAGISITLAGCSQNGDGSGDGSGDEGGDGGQGTGTTTGSPASGNQYDGVTVRYWDVHHSQSAAAKEAIQNLISEFEDETGATIESNLDSVGNYAGTKWISSFKRGDIPDIMTGFSHVDGKFIEGEFLQQYNQYSGNFDQETRNGIEWITDTVDYASRMWDGIYAFPFAFSPKNPLIARTDHFEEAGLDPENDFPPENYEDLIKVATTLQQDGPGDLGFQIHGTESDWLEITNPWAVSISGRDGAFMNEAADDTTIDNETWKETIRNWVAVYQEHGLSSGGTPNANDEDIPALIRSGQLSMSQVAPANHPSFMDQAGDLMKDGTIQWAPMWDQPSGKRGAFLLATVAITKPTGNGNEKRKKAASRFVNKLLSADFQENILQNFGYLPVRDDVWDATKSNVTGESGHKFAETAFSMAEDINVAWSFHPKQRPCMVTPASHMQRALQGEISPEQACQEAAEEIRNTVL